MNIVLDTPVRFVPHVGPVRAAALERLGIKTVYDLLYHIPFRYNDFSLVRPIAEVQPGETVTVKGKVLRFGAFATKSGKRIAEARVADDSGSISVIWFNQPYLRSVVKPGMTIHLSGTVSWFGQKIVMNSPEYELFELESDGDSSLHTGRIVPVYPATEGISPKWLRGRIAFLLPHILPALTDEMPEKLRRTYRLMDLAKAIERVHFPQSLDEAQDAKRRLAFDELLVLQMRAYFQKRDRETGQTAPALIMKKTDISDFYAKLPFRLTHDQQHACEEILSDLSRPFPMNRLLVGDVGSGKTVVSALAVYVAAKNGYKAAFMAPTQILATQHFASLAALLAPFGIKVGLVTAEHRMESRNTFDVLIGTHALLSDSVTIENLGVVVIDEQHRFGVTQRTLLTQKADTHSPHILTMTATPIPRTVAKTVMGHIDLSVLSQLPEGRISVQTWVVPKDRRQRAYAWITKQIRETEGQVFIICPLIEESETLTSVRAVKKEYEFLTREFRGFSLGLLHGRMKPTEKTTILEDFRKRKHHILVATPVVEVGIDIPNASIIVIEASERFGLSQLHQLRGRVGRGSLKSYCLLFTEAEDANTLGRLKILEKETSGPRLAEADLKLRGAGDILGVRQHGIPNLKIASFGDTKTITEAREAVTDLTKSDPDLTQFPHLREVSKNSTIESALD